MRRAAALALVAILCQAQVKTQYLSFVTCPIVRDTKTVPCWVAEYQGETYFLGIQSGVAGDFYPPQLNHEVLVEGVVAEGPRVCGGVPLRPVKTSVLLEINRACNMILPVEDGIEAPERVLSRETPTWVRSSGPGDSTIFFDFDNDFLSLHSTGAIQRAAEHLRQTKAAAIEVTAYRGSSKLSNGTTMVEQERIATLRANKVRDILYGLGVPAAAVKLTVVGGVRQPNGADDAASRKVTLAVK